MKSLKSVLFVFILLLAGLSFVSCDKDDDEGNGNSGGTSALVGTWRHEFSSGYILVTFKSDGTGSWKEIDYDSESFMDKFDYEYDKKEEVLTLWYEDGDTEEWYVSFESSNTMYLDDDKFIKQ